MQLNPLWVHEAGCDLMHQAGYDLMHNSLCYKQEWGVVWIDVTIQPFDFCIHQKLPCKQCAAHVSNWVSCSLAVRLPFEVLVSLTVRQDASAAVMCCMVHTHTPTAQ